MSNPIRPAFTLETALTKVQAAEDAWNSRDLHRVSMSYTENSEWRNRTEFFKGRDAIRDYLPADFLVAPSGRINAVKGTDAYDQWSVDELLTLAKDVAAQAL